MTVLFGDESLYTLYYIFITSFNYTFNTLIMNEEQIKYLKDNLKIVISEGDGGDYYRKTTKIEIKLLLNEEEISSDYVTIDA